MTDDESTQWATRQKGFILDFINQCDPRDLEGRLKLHFVWMSIMQEANRPLDVPQSDPNLVH